MVAGTIQIAVGIVAIVFGLRADAFYPAFMRRPKPGEKPMSRWVGLTIFTVVGIAFILSGISSLRHQ